MSQGKMCIAAPCFSTSICGIPQARSLKPLCTVTVWLHHDVHVQEGGVASISVSCCLTSIWSCWVGCIMGNRFTPVCTLPGKLQNEYVCRKCQLKSMKKPPNSFLVKHLRVKHLVLQELNLSLTYSKANLSIFNGSWSCLFLSALAQPQPFISAL